MRASAFPYRYDRTHDISVVANYNLGKKWEASAVFVYGTGNALTMPTGRFVYNLGYNVGESGAHFYQYQSIRQDQRLPYAGLPPHGYCIYVYPKAQ